MTLFLSPFIRLTWSIEKYGAQIAIIICGIDSNFIFVKINIDLYWHRASMSSRLGLRSSYMNNWVFFHSKKVSKIGILVGSFTVFCNVPWN